MEPFCERANPSMLLMHLQVSVVLFMVATQNDLGPDDDSFVKNIFRRVDKVCPKLHPFYCLNTVLINLGDLTPSSEC